MVITGHVHMLKKIAGNDAKSLRAIQAIETATQRGASLTRQLLYPSPADRASILKASI